MLPRISKVEPRDGYKLFVSFDEGRDVIYDVGDDIRQINDFQALQSVPNLFNNVKLDQSRTIIYWNDYIDLPSDTIYEYGTCV